MQQESKLASAESSQSLSAIVSGSSRLETPTRPESLTSDMYHQAGSSSYLYNPGTSVINRQVRMGQ